MARTFDGAADYIRTDVGACALTGAFTVVVVLRRNSNSAGYHNLLTAQTAATSGSQYGLEIESNGDGNNLQIQSGSTGFRSSSFSVTTSDGWVLVAGGKASGTTTPRMHKYVYSSNTWTHENANGTAGNPSTVSGGVLAFGRWEGVDDLDGDIAAAAIFDRNLADAEVEQLAHSLQGWLAAAPVGMWVLDQQSTGTAVNDWTGGGAQQNTVNGTAVATSSVPGLSYGAPVDVQSASASAGGVDSRAQTGDCSAAGAAFGAAGHVAVRTGSAAAAAATVAVAAKRIGGAGAAAAAVAASGAARKVVARTGISAAAASTSGTARKVAAGSSRSCAGAASFGQMVKRATPTGVSAAAASGTGAARKVVSRTGSTAAAAASYGVVGTSVSRPQTGTVCAAATSSGTARKVQPVTGPGVAGGTARGVARAVKPGSGTASAAAAAAGTQRTVRPRSGAGIAAAAAHAAHAAVKRPTGRTAAHAAAFGQVGEPPPVDLDIGTATWAGFDGGAANWAGFDGSSGYVTVD